MAHGYPGEADTAAYLVHNPQDIGETVRTKEGQPEPNPVADLMSSRTSRPNLVSGLPTAVTEGQMDVSITVASILDNNVFSVLGDMGVSDLWSLVRGMRYGPGKRQVFGYNPVYDALMGSTNTAFNAAMAAIQKRVSDERFKAEKKEEDPLKEVKGDYNNSLRGEASHYMNGIGVGLEFYRRLPAGTSERVAIAEAERILGNYDGATYRGIMNGIQVLASPASRDRLIGRNGVSVDEAVRELKGAMLNTVKTNWMA